MDLPALLGRAPELALIDELAHSNAPGVEHAKRYEDITDVLAAGIDVFSTVNVQHLESLNDRVAELTGTRVRETVPDSVIAVADEIVLVDLTPEALIARLQAGKVYPQERVEAALNHFFRIENLSALREVALREVAEEVETKRRVSPFAPERALLGTREDRPQPPAASSQAIQERLLALVTPDPQSQRVVRRAARSAQRLDGELDLLYVRPPGREPSAREREQLEALRRLAAVLGAHLLLEEGDDVAEIAARVARERGTTYVLIGVAERAARACAASPSRSTTACSSCCRASTCGSSPTAGVSRLSADRADASGPANVNSGWVGGGFECRWRGCAMFVGIIATNIAHPRFRARTPPQTHPYPAAVDVRRSLPRTINAPPTRRSATSTAAGRRARPASSAGRAAAPRARRRPP